MSGLTVYDAIFNGLALIENPDWKHHQQRAAESGIFQWLAIRRDLKRWTDLLPGHVMEFSNWMRTERGLAESTISKYINPVRLASRWVHLYRPQLYRDLFVRGVVRKTRRTRPLRYLMADQVHQAIPIARRLNYPEVVAAFHFGAFAGLRLQEIMALTPDSLHEDGLHTGTKNEYSVRLIPLLPEVMEFAGMYFTLFDRCPVKNYTTLSRRIREVLNECSDMFNDPTFRQCEPHEALRTTFINIANRAGCEMEAVRAYAGQAPNNVMAGHYADLIPTLDDMPRIRASKVEVMTNRVLLPVREKIMQECENKP